MPGNFYTITIYDIINWPVPNYTNPVERTWLPGYAIFWEILTTAFVGGRLYLRIRNRSGAFGLDDLFVLLAWMFSLAFTVTACLSVWQYDIGRHVWDVRPDKYPGALYYAWVAQVMFIHSTGATKMSVLLFYRRMAANTYSKKWLYAVWTLLFITGASWISMFVAYCFMCTPLNTYWDIETILALTPDAPIKCLNGDAVTIAAGVITIASDFWTAALPCAMFQSHDLGVSRRQKIALNIIFCLGFLVTGIGIARTYYLWAIGQNQDLSWIGYNLFVTSIVETQLAIILCCAPFLRALFRRYLPNLTHQSRSTRTDTENGKSQTRQPTRQSIRWSNLRGSSFQPTPPLYKQPETEEIDLDHREETTKKGYLVLEGRSGKLVWNDRDNPSQAHR